MLNVLLTLVTLWPQLDLGVGSAVPLFPLYTRYPDHNNQVIARVPFAVPFLTLWFGDHYGVEIRNEGAAFGTAFLNSPVNQVAVSVLVQQSKFLMGIGPFFALTELGGYTDPQEQWKNWAFGLEWMIAKPDLPLWHALKLRPWLRLGYINFLTTPKWIDGDTYSIYPANELRNLWSLDLGVDLVLPIRR